MRKGEIQWENFARELLWHEIVYHKNEPSGYYIVDKDCGRYPKGHIQKGLCVMSDIHPSCYHELTWKELALGLGLFEEYLIGDGHDCKICKSRETCHAYFKDDPDHECCNGWEKEEKE